MPLPIAAGAAGVLSVAMGYMIGRIAFKIITGLGLGVIAYVGFSALFDEINLYITTTLSGVPVQVAQLLEVCNVFQAINLIFSAYVSRWTIVPIYKRLTFGNTPA